MDGVGTVWNDRLGWTSRVEVVRSTLQAAEKRYQVRREEDSFVCSLLFFCLLFFFLVPRVATPQGFFVFLMKLWGRNRNGNKGDRVLRGGSVLARKKV